MFDGTDKAVSAASDGLDVAGIVGRVTEDPPELVHGSVETVLEIDKGAFAPDLIAELFACDYIPGMSEEEKEDLKGLAGQADASATFEQLFCGDIYFKWSEGQPGLRLRLSNHRLRRLS